MLSSDLFWGRPTLAIATVGLTLAGLTGNLDRRWPWILGLACFIVLHSIVNWLRERSTSGRLGRNSEIVQRRVWRLISDLSDLTAREFDLWMVDLYLPQTSMGFSTSFPFVSKKKLVRKFSLALTDVRPLPPEMELNHMFFGPCFSNAQPRIWWDVNLVGSSIGDDNWWYHLDKVVNDKLREMFGAIRVNPIVDSLGKQCQGLLIVHTKSDAEVATKALGALTQSEGIRRLAGACEDIHSQIRK